MAFGSMGVPILMAVLRDDRDDVALLQVGAAGEQRGTEEWEGRGRREEGQWREEGGGRREEGG